MRNELGLACVLCACGAACAQTTTDVALVYSLSWTDTGNDNGIVEPGESIDIVLGVTISPSVGSIVGYTPFGGPATTGTLRGIASGFVDLKFNAGVTGIWSNIERNYTWEVGQLPGSIQNGGNLLANFVFGQFPISLAHIYTQNSIPDLLSGRFTPSAYGAPSDVGSMSVLPGSASGGNASWVLIQNSPTTFITPRSLSQFGSIQIPGLVPAPASITLLGIGLAMASPRRRRGLR